MFAKLFKRIEFWIFFLIALAMILMFSPLAYAETAGQFNGDTQGNYWHQITNAEYFAFFFSSSTLSNFTTSSDITLKFKTTADLNSSYMDVQLYNTCGGMPLLDNDGDPNSWIGLGRATSTWDGTYMTYTIYPSAWANMAQICNGRKSPQDIGGFYFNQNHSSSNPNARLYGLSGTSGVYWYYRNGYYIGEDTLIQAPYYEFSQGGSTPSTPTIAFSYPIATTTPFDNWQFILQNSTSTTPSFVVRYSRNSSSSAELDQFSTSTTSLYDVGMSNKASSTTPFYAEVFKANQLWYPPLSSPVLWFAKVYVLDDGYNTVASSSVISFNYYPSGTPPVSTTTVAEAEIACTSGGFFENTFCDIISYLFYPSDNVLGKYTNIKNELSTKPPFGYFSSISTALSNINTSTTPAFWLPVVNFAPLNALRSGITMLLWLAYVFWVFHRLRHLNI